MIAVLEAANIAIIGTGSLGSILARSLISSHEGSIIATKRNIDELEWLREYGVITTKDNSYAIFNSDISIVALKPDKLEVLAGIEIRKDQLVVSTVAKKTISEISDLLNHEKIIRVMPNIGLRTNTGVTGYSLSAACDEKDADVVRYVFGDSGYVFKTKEENLAMVTVGACMPGLIAQVYRRCGRNILLEQSLRRAYTSFLERELDPEVAREIVNSSFATVDALANLGESYSSIYRRVASPGGGTVKAHNSLIANRYYLRLMDELNYGQYKTALNYVEHLELALNHFKGK